MSETSSLMPIYRWLSRCGDELSTAAKLVLGNLLGRLGHNTSAWPSQRRLAADTALSEPTVRKGIAELEARGFISKRRRGTGRQLEYEVNVASLRQLARNESPFLSDTKAVFGSSANDATIPPQARAGSKRNALTPEVTEEEEPPKEGPPEEGWINAIMARRTTRSEAERFHAHIPPGPFRDRAINAWLRKHGVEEAS